MGGRSDGEVVLKQGNMFEDKKQFFDVFKNYLVQEGIYVNYIKNERKRFTAVHRSYNSK